MGISDKSFIDKVEKLIEQNADRFTNSNSLVKFIIFTHVLAAQKGQQPKFKELFLKKLKSFSLDNLYDPRGANNMTQLNVCIA